MGEIIAAGLLRSGKRSPDELIVADVSEERVRHVVDKYGFHPATSNADAVKRAGTVLLAVKPQDMDNVLNEIHGTVGDGHLVVSIAAGLSTRYLEERLPEQAAVVRIMPNTAAQVGEGMAAICRGRHATDEQLAAAAELVSGVGRTVTVAEGHMDAVTALSGSGPAYFALFAEAMVDAGVTAGLARSVAGELVAQTMLGTAAMIRDGGMQPVQVREAVTSPGGVTAVAVRELERGKLRAAVQDAIQAAVDRSKALGTG